MPSVDLAAALHASRHAADGPDPITPADIGAPDNAQVSGSYYNLSGVSTPFGPDRAESIGTAVNKVSSALGIINLQLSSKADKSGSTYVGHVDSLREPGAYRISGSAMNAGNGYPWTPDATGYVIVHGYSTAYVTQEVISESGVTWRRNSVAGSTTSWRDWTPIAVDTGWRTYPLDNGWTGDLQYRWRNGIVTVSITGLDGTSATNSNIVTNFGSHPGFHAGAGTPALGLGHMTSNGSAPQGSNIGTIGLVGGTPNSIMRASSTTGWRGGAASMTYVASSATLPATLPGTPA